MSLWICPICGKQNSIKHYDPTNFDNDILIIVLRGLGKGGGFEETERFSLLDGSDPYLLNLISDRLAVVYDMLFEDVEDDDEAEAEDEDDESDTEQDDEDGLKDYESLIKLTKEIRVLEEKMLRG